MVHCEKAKPCLIFPFIVGCVFPLSSPCFFCLLFTRGYEICSLRLLLFCASVTRCEAICLFVLCSELPVDRHAQNKGKSYLVHQLLTHSKAVPLIKEEYFTPSLLFEGHRDSSCSEKISLIIILM